MSPNSGTEIRTNSIAAINAPVPTRNDLKNMLITFEHSGETKNEGASDTRGKSLLTIVFDRLKIQTAESHSARRLIPLAIKLEYSGKNEYFESTQLFRGTTKVVRVCRDKTGLR